MKIQLKKMNLKGQMRGVVIANLLIFALLVILLLIEGADATGMAAYEAADLIIKATFMIGQSVLISKLVIEEFKTRTVQHLYTYPLNRLKVMAAKIGLIFILMSSFLLVSQVVQHGLFHGLALIFSNFSYPMSMMSMAVVATTSIFSVLVGMLPIAVGLWTKSTVAPVVSSFLLIAVLGGSFGDEGLDMMNNLMGMLVLGLVGLAVAGFAVRDVLKKDLIV